MLICQQAIYVSGTTGSVEHAIAIGEGEKKSVFCGNRTAQLLLLSSSDAGTGAHAAHVTDSGAHRRSRRQTMDKRVTTRKSLGDRKATTTKDGIIDDGRRETRKMRSRMEVGRGV